MGLPALPDDYEATRVELHRLAAHVLARRRSAIDGRFGLRATPAGMATPAAGPEHEVVRTSGTWLVRERTADRARTTALDLRGATLRQAAAFVDVDVDQELSVGADTPDRGDVDAPLALGVDAVVAFAGWFGLCWPVLDVVVAEHAGAGASVVQLWPEHLDAGCDLAVGVRARANVGASAGDGYSPEPYLYVGPWGPRRPGDAAYWNAPFGATVGYAELAATPDPAAAGRAFLRRGLELLAS